MELTRKGCVLPLQGNAKVVGVLGVQCWSLIAGKQSKAQLPVVSEAYAAPGPDVTSSGPSAEPGGRGARAPGAGPGAAEGEPSDLMTRSRDPRADPSMATAGVQLHV